MSKEYNIVFKLMAKYGNNVLGLFGRVTNSIGGLNEKTNEYTAAAAKMAKAGKENEVVFEGMTGALSRYLQKFPRLTQILNNPNTAKALKFTGIAELGNIAYNKSMQMARGMYEASRGAMEFESAMADVRKVVDFESADQFKKMSKDILDLSTRIPIAKEGLAQIVAAGGQSGIAREDLLSFAESAAKMGVAFDITADQAGEMMAKWRTAFKMNQDQVVTLADQINYLGNTTAASAPKISEVVTRIGPLGEIGGVAAGEIAALGASMVGSGVESEVAATSIKNLILAMTAGESATGRQEEALAKLGFEAEDLAARMQTDAKGAIVDFFEVLQSQDVAERGAILRNIVGKESIEGLSGFLNNLDLLKENFGKVADASQYAGSMQAEYDERSKTTENSIQLMNNQFEAMKVTIMTSLLPIIQGVTKFVGGLAQKLQEFANEHPQLMSILVTGTALFVGLGVVLGGLVAIIAPIITAVTGLAATFGVAATTILAVGAAAIGVIAGVAALAAAVYLYWDEICAFLSNEVAYIDKVITDGFNSAWNAIMDFCKNLRKDFSEVFDWLSGKWEWISGILSQPISTTVSAIFSSDKAESNAAGGIYSRGAFLTTFAEDSGESAIPHTPTARNIGLLARTNEIMGSPLGGNSYSIPISITVNGSADAGAASSIAAEVEAAVRRALANIENQKVRVSYA